MSALKAASAAKAAKGLKSAGGRNSLGVTLLLLATGTVILISAVRNRSIIDVITGKDLGDATDYGIRASEVTNPLDPNQTAADVLDNAIPISPGGTVYPLAVKGQLIGFPHQGTHTLGNWQSDNAVDIGVPNGTRVLAVKSGVITRVSGSYAGGASQFDGYRVYLDVGGGTQWWYTHLSSVSVRAGQRVNLGQVIGLSGSANGTPHLHIAVNKGNPQKLLGL